MNATGVCLGPALSLVILRQMDPYCPLAIQGLNIGPTQRVVKSLVTERPPLVAMK